MTVYKNHNADSPLAAVEFTPVADGNLSFFYVKNAAHVDAVRQLLTAPEVGQRIIGEAKINGQQVLIARGEKSRDDMLQLLSTLGDNLKIHHESRGLAGGAWMMRSALGMTGQGLQLASSLMQGKRNWGLFTFAVANIAANTVNFIYGSQKSDDTHQLHFIKGRINDNLGQYIQADGLLPAVDDDRLALRKEPTGPQSTGAAINEFMKKHSVRIGELGLRYLGAIGLAFPTDRWGLVKDEIKTGELSRAYQVGHASRIGGDAGKRISELSRLRKQTGSLPPEMRQEMRDLYQQQPASLSHYVGLGSMAGKTIALMSKPEDPFNPKPPNWLDTMREKFTFRAGGWIEAVAFGTLSYDAFRNGKITYPKAKFIPATLRGTTRRDYLSGIGGALFTLAYVTRHWAKFSEKNVNMDEVFAHATDSIAQMPPEKRTQLMVETAAEITNHFKDKKLDFGKVFEQLTHGLYRYNHIALNLGNGSEKPAAEVAAEAPIAAAPEQHRRQRDHVAAPAGNYVDAVKAGKDMPLGIGA